MVVAFEGWNDAGEAASLAVDHLAGMWEAEVAATIEAEVFYDFTVARPEVGLDEHSGRYLVWPDPEVLIASPDGSDRDVVLLRGVEPHMRWKTFCTAVAEIAQALRVETVVLLGALLADIPHTRPARVSGSSDDARLSQMMALSTSSYEGPTGIVGVLYDYLRNDGIAAASLWASVPHYVQQLPSPKAMMALLERLSILLGVPIETSELLEASREYEEEVSEQIGDDPETVAYVADLERAEDAELASGATVPSNEAVEGLAAEAEKYLREHPS
jgi:proteasome assembly chaperone (PAC2) family protein